MDRSSIKMYTGPPFDLFSHCDLMPMQGIFFGRGMGLGVLIQICVVGKTEEKIVPNKNRHVASIIKNRPKKKYLFLGWKALSYRRV